MNLIKTLYFYYNLSRHKKISDIPNDLHSIRKLINEFIQSRPLA
jgi:hypothetical protein